MCVRGPVSSSVPSFRPVRPLEVLKVTVWVVRPVLFPSVIILHFQVFKQVHYKGLILSVSEPSAIITVYGLTGTQRL